HTSFSRDWSSDVCSSDLTRSTPTATSPRACGPDAARGRLAWRAWDQSPRVWAGLCVHRLLHPSPDQSPRVWAGLAAALEDAPLRAEERRGGKGGGSVRGN